MKDPLFKNHWQQIRETTCNNQLLSSWCWGKSCYISHDSEHRSCNGTFDAAYFRSFRRLLPTTRAFLKRCKWTILFNVSHFLQALSARSLSLSTCLSVHLFSVWASILFLAMIVYREEHVDWPLMKAVSKSIPKHFAVLITLHPKTEIFKL